MLSDRVRGGAALAASLVFVVAGLLASAVAVAAPGPVIQVLSTRPDLVSGGDALVSIAPAAQSVSLNGADVSKEFAVRPDGLYEGLLTGLATGANKVVATTAGGSVAELTITGHPQSGPVFSGPQVQPWTCNAGALDASCDRAPTYAYDYMPSSGGGLQSYDPNNPPPSPAIATTTTDQGHTVPFIVRLETGSIDRGQYQIAVLDDPAKPWVPWAPQSGWNGKLEIPGGSSCGTGHTEATNPSVTDTHALGLGFAVASEALLNNGNNCNIVTQAESVEMMKEYLVDHYGPIRYTIATGCSGGSIFQQQTNNAYPGLYQGETVSCSYPDDWSTNMEPVDCQLLLSYWTGSAAATQQWTEAQEAEVAGHQQLSACTTWADVYGYNQLFNPAGNGSNVGPGCGVPAAQEYSASNPGGVRCDAADYMSNVFGFRPPSAWTAPERAIGHGFANRPYDNVGVQYGLGALMAGQITPAQFADLNANVGGLTIDDTPQTARSAADPASLPIVYRSGAVNEYNNLAGVPIIDLRGHDTVEIHEDFRSYASRARLDHSNGGHANQVIWLGPVPLAGDGQYSTTAFDTVDQWLTNVAADRGSGTDAQKVARDKPAAAVDECYDGNGNVVPDQQACQTLFPSYQDPRIVAGEPFSDDVIKCQLKPLVRSDYLPVQFTDAEWSQLQSAFPTGVCDYGEPGVGQRGAIPWLTYQDAAGNVIYGGRPLGPAPVSIPFGPGGPGVLPAAASCASRRNFTIHLSAPRGQSLNSAVIYVNHRRVRALRGRRLHAPVNLTGLPRGRFTIRIVAHTNRGRTIRSARRYRTCIKRSTRQTARAKHHAAAKRRTTKR